MKSTRFDPCQLLSSFDGRKKLEQPVNARCWPELVGSGQSNKWAYHRKGLSPLWQVQRSHQQQLKRGDICEVHPWGSQKTKGSRKHELTTTTSSGEQSSKCGTEWKLHGFTVSPCQVEPTKTRTNYAGSRRTPRTGELVTNSLLQSRKNQKSSLWCYYCLVDI